MIEILKQIEKIKSRIDSIQKEATSNYPDDYKKQLSIEEAVFRKLKDNLEFQILSPENKQAKRINSLASCRKAGGDCSRYERTINIYDEIRRSLPYVKALNNFDQLLSIELLCDKEVELIDDSLTGDIKRHITAEEVEEAFKPYFERTALTKYDMFKECYEKIESLYNELKAISETA